MSYDIKYLHVFVRAALNYNKSIVEMINDEKFGFNRNEHLFVMKAESNYEALKVYENVIYEGNIIEPSMKRFNEYAAKSQHIFLHSNELTYFELLHLRKATIRKIIWCVWGHDLYYMWQPINQVSGIYNKSKRFAANIYMYLRKRLRNTQNKKMMAIGIGFKYDALEIRKQFGQRMPILMLPYGYIPNKRNQIDMIKNTKEEHGDKRVKIMIGHSAYKFLNHKVLLEKLTRFRNEKILISLVLSYGDMNYAKEIAEFAKEQFGNQVEIISQSMPYEAYLHYLKTVDICILDYMHQSALGNVFRLLYLEKKLFLNEYGIIKTALTLEGVETYSVDNIDKMGFEEFIKPVEKPENAIRLSSYYVDEMFCVDMWKNTLKTLKWMNSAE